MADVKSNTPKVPGYLPDLFSILEKWSPRLAGKLALRLFLKPIRFKTPQREKEALENARVFNISVEKYKVAIYEWGEGPVIWVFHGWSGRATQLYEITKQLVRNGYKVYGIDAPGHGKSTGNDSSVLLYESALQELNRLKGPPLAYIGHSLGGAVGFLAYKNGIKIKKLVSIGAPAISDAIIMEALQKVGAGKITLINLNKAFLKKFGEPFENFTVLNWIKNPPDVPVLIVHDKDDRDAPFHHAETLAAALPDAEFYVTTGLGHNRILRDNEVIKKVINFITEKPKHE
ncbi:MAG TPA: alpha/beta hydrolase [Bacteroidetes bacterium]|nr:alpha/beta hydrolase [Bacteroidota bacterium]